MEELKHSIQGRKNDLINSSLCVPSDSNKNVSFTSVFNLNLQASPGTAHDDVISQTSPSRVSDDANTLLSQATVLSIPSDEFSCVDFPHASSSFSTSSTVDISIDNNYTESSLFDLSHSPITTHFANESLISSSLISSTTTSSSKDNDTQGLTMCPSDIASSSVSIGELSMGSDSVFNSESENVSSSNRTSISKGDSNNLSIDTDCDAILNNSYHTNQSIIADYLTSHRNSISKFLETLSCGDLDYNYSHDERDGNMYSLMLTNKICPYDKPRSVPDYISRQNRPSSIRETSTSDNPFTFKSTAYPCKNEGHLSDELIDTSKSEMSPQLNDNRDGNRVDDYSFSTDSNKIISLTYDENRFRSMQPFSGALERDLSCDSERSDFEFTSPVTPCNIPRNSKIPVLKLDLKRNVSETESIISPSSNKNNKMSKLPPMLKKKLQPDRKPIWGSPINLKLNSNQTRKTYSKSNPSTPTGEKKFLNVSRSASVSYEGRESKHQKLQRNSSLRREPNEFQSRTTSSSSSVPCSPTLTRNRFMNRSKTNVGMSTKLKHSDMKELQKHEGSKYIIPIKKDADQLKSYGISKQQNTRANTFKHLISKRENTLTKQLRHGDSIEDFISLEGECLITRN